MVLNMHQVHLEVHKVAAQFSLPALLDDARNENIWSI